MSVYIHNSLSRKKEEFLPVNPPKLNIYSCGVTVYDDCHIGHARSLYIFDVISRYLKYRGFDVRFVRNITDIDDKIINRANELKTGWKELVAKYISRYYEDLAALGIGKADSEPRATENIEDMKRHIQGLIDKGYAYPTDTGVYFSVRKFKDYGKLSGQGIEQMLTGVRKDADETKEDPLDFALWKRSKPGEPFWESPWGQGRPGWHIECSVMSAKYLKAETLDIHAGGRDLIFPHHENEIAQSEALTGKPFARYWIHHGLLTINGQKMSKSLGNFITIKDALAKYPADVLKIFFLQAHYSSPIDFSDDKMKEAGQALERIRILLNKIKIQEVKNTSVVSRKKNSEIDSIRNKFLAAMDDDFNTPQGLAAIFDLVSVTNKNIDKLEFINEARIVLAELLQILGISLKWDNTVNAPKIQLKAGLHDPAVYITQEEVDSKVAEREKARKNKDYAASDRIRKELEVKGVILEDTKDGTTWRRKL
ncbi:MAG: cysteine--tRNA ligase [Candidatus Omnitrophica bacterium]|jgi:cysteinyl-tRNA synthetase|nr:cysteine--tRNA ligase [Candidatus Omnitrophota bacterium]